MTMLYLLYANHITDKQPALVRTMAACPRPLSVGGLDNSYRPHHFRVNFCLNITFYITNYLLSCVFLAKTGR